jgi:hypothetical protein
MMAVHRVSRRAAPFENQAISSCVIHAHPPRIGLVAVKLAVKKDPGDSGNSRPSRGRGGAPSDNASIFSIQARGAARTGDRGGN